MIARILLLLAVASPLAAASIPVDWTTNHAPFRIGGNLYYVGSNDLAAYLIVTPEGNILLNANLPSSAPLIQQSIESLGFKMADTKILLNGQAHYDHVGATAVIKRMTHARVEVMDADVDAMQSGGKTDFLFYKDPSAQFEPVKVDHVLHDGEQVRLGSSVLTAHLTPGHTKGDTTWTMQIVEAGKPYEVVFFGGAGVNPGNNLIDDPRYPTEAADFERAFRTLRSLPCDVFLGAHGIYFGLKEKYARFRGGDKNAFVDPAGYRAYTDDREKAFRDELDKQRAARKQ